MAGQVVLKTVSQDVISETVQPLYIGGKLADGSDAKLTVATDGSISTATPLTVPSLTVNSKPVMSSLLASYTVTGSAVTSIDFSGLDINTHKSYRVEIDWFNASAGNTRMEMFVNGDMTTTNYYEQTMTASSSTIGGGRYNDAGICYSPSTGNLVKAIVFVGLVLGYPHSNSFSAENVGSTMQIEMKGHSKTTTVANITQLTFTTVAASAIGVGSKIRIYRGDV